MTDVKWEEIVRSNYPELLKYVDTKNGLEGECKKLCVFSARVTRTLWETKDTTKRIADILDLLLRGDKTKFLKFCDALKNSDQENIVLKYLSCTRCVTDVADACPVPSETDSLDGKIVHSIVTQRMTRNWNTIIEKMTSDPLFLSLLANAFSEVQMQKLRDIDNETDRNECILRLLERGSARNYQGFIRALKGSSQEHIVKKYLYELKLDSEVENSESSAVQATSAAKETDKFPIMETTTPAPFLFPTQATESHYEEVHEGHTGEGLEHQQIDSESTAASNTPQHQADSTTSDNVACPKLVFKRVTHQVWSRINQQIQNREAYEINTGKPRGHAILLDNWCVSYEGRTSRFQPRIGAQIDDFNLRGLFNKLHYSIATYRDLNAQDIKEMLKKESQDERLRNSDSLIVFILSHGCPGNVLGYDGGKVSTDEIVQIFDGKHCPLLRQKPKIFFIQACQGDLVTEGVNRKDGEMNSIAAVGEGEPVVSEDPNTLLASDPTIASTGDSIAAVGEVEPMVSEDLTPSVKLLTSDPTIASTGNSSAAVSVTPDAVVTLDTNIARLAALDVLGDYDASVVARGSPSFTKIVDCNVERSLDSTQRVSDLGNVSSVERVVEAPMNQVVEEKVDRMQSSDSGMFSGSDFNSTDGGFNSREDLLRSIPDLPSKSELTSMARDVTDASVEAALDATDAPDNIDRVHERADIAVALATVEGYVAWRNESFGSWFVRCILNVFEKKAHEEDLMSMLTQVLQNMQDMKTDPNHESNRGFLQMGEKKDSLTKKFYLLPLDINPSGVATLDSGR